MKTAWSFGHEPGHLVPSDRVTRRAAAGGSHLRLHTVHQYNPSGGAGASRATAPRRAIPLFYSGPMSEQPRSERFEFTDTASSQGPAHAHDAAHDHGASDPDALPDETLAEVNNQMRDIAEVPAVEVITTAAVHLMSAAAVKCGLAAEENAEELKDLDEARKLIIALAGLITAAAPEIGSQHAGPLRDGLKSLQLAFREASPFPDAPGAGPGEKFTGPVYG